MPRFAALPVATLWLASMVAHADIRDLRDEKWKTTSVRNVGTGVVQHTGDDTKFGNFAELIREHLQPTSATGEHRPVEIKTVDVRLTLPNARVDEVALQSAQNAMPKGGVVAGPVALLLSAFSKDKTASAVFCVSIDGRNYLGNDARLFRFGAEQELKDSIQAALAKLEAAVKADTVTESPACDAGWEGGQAQQL